MIKKNRLQKYLAESGVASRRKSEEIIKSGRVSVNGQTVTEMGVCITDADEVSLDGKKIAPNSKKYIVFNKPAGLICSKEGQFDRKTIYEIIPDKDVFSIGRLDMYSKGLLLLTNDGDFANNIAHPSNEITKTYEVQSNQIIPLELLENFKKGIKVNNVIYKAISIDKTGEKKVIIKLNEGKKREIREVFDYYNISIIELKRISIGFMNLPDLQIDESRYIYITKEKLEKLIYGR